MSAALNAIPTPVFEAALVLIAGSTTLSFAWLTYALVRGIWGARS